MASVKFFNVHRTWEDYLGMLLGVLIVLSPAFAGHEVATAVMINAGVVGVLVLALASFELVDLHRWEETLELVCGLWLMASPFVLGYAGGALMVWHLALGAIVALLAVFELWQDWKLSDQDLAAHGH
ncbi:MAG: SPW repeat protein [Gammaproteobacteria bacterium]|nr:SPW repeat protein [Gammaproteobacteria bacterium]